MTDALGKCGGLRWSSQHFLSRVEGVVVVASRMSVAEKLEIWRLLRAGTSFRVVGRRLGRSDASIQQYVRLTGGVRPRERCRAAKQRASEGRLLCGIDGFSDD